MKNTDLISKQRNKNSDSLAVRVGALCVFFSSAFIFFFFTVLTQCYYIHSISQFRASVSAMVPVCREVVSALLQSSPKRHGALLSLQPQVKKQLACTASMSLTKFWAKQIPKICSRATPMKIPATSVRFSCSLFSN